MAEPSRRSSRLAIAFAALCALGLAGGSFLLGQRSTVEAPKAPTPRPVPVPQPELPALPVVQPPLGRADLIAATSEAADALGSGPPLSAAARGLAGRSFELRLPFGCAGDGGIQDPALSWRYDESSETLRFRVEPASWSPAEWLAEREEGGESASVEGIQGFWIARPWTTSDACPRPTTDERSAAGGGSAADPETLGIAQFFRRDDSRTGRRDGKPYEAAVKADPEQLNTSQGFQLVISGRISSGGPGASILCKALSGANVRPTCLIVAEFDRIAIHNPASGSVIATWDVATQAANLGRQKEQ